MGCLLSVLHCFLSPFLDVGAHETKRILVCCCCCNLLAFWIFGFIPLVAVVSLYTEGLSLERLPTEREIKMAAAEVVINQGPFLRTPDLANLTITESTWDRILHFFFLK